MTFPLLRLPLLASTEVIKNIGVEELLLLIQCSFKTRNLVKLSKIPIRLGFHNSLITVQNSDSFASLYQMLSIEKAVYVGRNQRIYRQDESQLIDFFMDIFVVKSISFHKCFNFNLMEQAKNLGLKFEEVNQTFYYEHTDFAGRFLNICSAASVLKVNFYCAKGFKFDGFHDFTVGTFNLSILSDSSWFKLDHLCSLINCSHVTIQKVDLTSEDLNKYLKFWMNSAGKLRSITLNLSNEFFIDAGDLMDGIDYRELGQNNTFEIRRDDGVKAKVICGNLRFCLKVIDL
ncbi:unnamed protein product [Caenorhabditis brenneri]